MIISYLYIYMDGAPSLHLIPLPPATNPPFPAVAGSVPAFFCGCCCCPVCGLRLRCSGLDHPCDCLRCCEASWLTLAVGGEIPWGWGRGTDAATRDYISNLHTYTHTYIYRVWKNGFVHSLSLVGVRKPAIHTAKTSVCKKHAPA